MQQFQVERIRLQRLERSIFKRSFNNQPLLPAEAPVFCGNAKTTKCILDNWCKHRAILRTRKENICIVLILRNYGIGKIRNIGRPPHHQAAGFAVILQRALVDRHALYAGILQAVKLFGYVVLRVRPVAGYFHQVTVIKDKFNRLGRLLRLQTVVDNRKRGHNADHHEYP
ncbi:hypothetical protein D3C73_1075550 [compost metagenome]